MTSPWHHGSDPEAAIAWQDDADPVAHEFVGAVWDALSSSSPLGIADAWLNASGVMKVTVRDYVPPPPPSVPGPPTPAVPPPVVAPSDEMVAAAQVWLTQRGFLDRIDVSLGQVLPQLWAAAWANGQAEAQRHVEDHDKDDRKRRKKKRKRKARPAPPPPPPAALTPAQQLAALLANPAFAAWVSASLASQLALIVGSLARRIAVLLATAMLLGWSANQLAQKLEEVFLARWRAEMIAATEASRAYSAAMFWLYRLMGIRWVRWQTRNDARVCPRCLKNQRAGAIRLGRKFPSGDKFPPSHPRCRCWLVPARRRDRLKGKSSGPSLVKADKPWKHVDTSRPVAEQVHAQLLQDYPPDSINWVKDAEWSGPKKIPLDAVSYTPEKWQAGHERAKVERFRKKIKKRLKGGDPVKPVILIDRPDTDRDTHLIVIDGHHRTMAFHELGEPVIGYVGKMDMKTARVAEETHASQFGTSHPGASENAASKSAAGYSLNERSGMISLDLPEGLIEPLPGGVSDHHVTIVYLGPDVDDDALMAARLAAAQAAARTPPCGTVGGIGSFPANEDGVPVWAEVDVPGAAELHQALAHLQHPDAAVARTGTYIPHMTLAYLGEDDPIPPALPPVPVTFTHLPVHRGKDEVHQYPFGAAKSAQTPVVSTVHHPLGHEGLWHTPSKKVPVMQQLPAYFQNTARALMRDHGMGESEAIATAINAVKEWARGRAFGGRVKVTPQVRAAAARALKEWEDLKASHH